MSLGIYFVHVGFTPEKYGETIKKLEAAGAGAPKGRKHHFALESDGSIQVFDEWETKEDFEAFGQTLIPILMEMGVELGEPSIATIINSISG